MVTNVRSNVGFTAIELMVMVAAVLVLPTVALLSFYLPGVEGRKCAG